MSVTPLLWRLPWKDHEMSSQRDGQAPEGLELPATSSDEQAPQALELPATSSAWAPFASRAFCWLWLANIVNSLGTWIQNTASGWIMTDLAPSPIMVSLVQAAAQLPVFLLALPAGALADLMDRKRNLMLTNMFMLAVAGALAIIAALGHVDATVLLVMTALLAVGAALNNPAWGASVQLTVPRQDLPQALVLNSVGFNITRVVGPAVAGLILATAGATIAFAANAASFAFVVVVVGAVLTFPRTRTSIDVPREPFRSAMRVGVAYSLAEPVVRSALVRSAAFYGCGSAIWALLPLYVRQVLGLSSASFGVMMGVIGAGAVLGAVGMPRLRKLIPRNNLIMLSGVLCGLALIPLAIIPSAATAHAALLVFGIAWIVGATNLQATVQLAAAPWGLGGRPRGSDGTHSRRRPGKLRHCAPDASRRTPCGDQRPIGSGQAGCPHPVDRSGDGAASAQRPASAAGRDQLPHRSGQRRSISRRHGGRPTVPISRRCGTL